MLYRVTRRAFPFHAAAFVLVGLVVPTIALADDHANAPSLATAVPTNGTSIAGSIENPSDQDWFKFDALAGVKYTVSTGSLSAGMDTVIELRGPTGALVAQDDDSGGGYASKLEAAPGAGTCTVLVRHYYPSRTGTYRLAVQAATTSPTPVAGTGATIAAARVFDPKLMNASLPVATRLATGGSYDGLIVVSNSSGWVRTVANQAGRQSGSTYTDAWDGRDAQGRFVAPGAYVLRFTASRGGVAVAQATASVSVVRLGARAVRFLDDGVGEPRVKLLYHRSTPTATGSYFALDSAGSSWTLPRSPLGDGCLDAPSGSVLVDPAPWSNLATPPREANGSLVARGRSLPVAYRQGATPHVSLTIGDGASVGSGLVGVGYPLAGVPIRVHAGAAPSTAITPNTLVTVELPPLPTGIRRLDLDLDFQFQYLDGSTWRDVPGVQRTRHRVYTVVGPSRMSSPAGGLAWVAVVDQVAAFSNGSATDAPSTLAAITAGVNARLGLKYDIVMGASAYAGGSLANPDLDLSSFVDRKAGSTINCSDCASVVSTYARQVGVDAQVEILGWNFDLHWIKGIGGTKFIHNLFGGYHAFSYHAVATIDAGKTLHDACLAVDGDVRPDVAPHVEKLPVAMPFAEYRRQLTPGTFQIDSLGRTTAR